MGSDDLAERLRLQAAIKVAAAFVHQARRNRAGVRTNLVGARARLDDAGEAGAEVAASAAAVDRLLEAVETESVPLEAIEPPDLPALLGRRPWPAATRSAVGAGSGSRARAPSAGARTPSRSRSAG